MVDSTHNGSAAAAYPAPPSASGTSVGAARLTSVVPLLSSDADVSLLALMNALVRLEVLFRTSGESLSVKVEPPASDLNPEHISGGDSCEEATSSGSHPTGPDVLSTLNALAVAAAQCDAEVSQHLTALRCGVFALTQELNTFSERYPSMSTKTCWAGTAGRAGSPSSSPCMILRTPQIVASTTSAPPGGNTSGTASALQGSPSDSSPRDLGHTSLPLAERSIIVTPATTPQLLPVGSSSRRNVGGDSGGLGPGSAAGSATQSAGKAGASAKSALSTPTPPLNATASPSHAVSPAIAQASPPIAFSHVDRPELQLPAAHLPHAACMESVKKYLSHCVEWPPRPREQRRAPPRQDLNGSRPPRRDDLSDSGRGDSTGFKVEGSGTPPMRLGLSGDMTHRRSDTDEFLRRLTEESPYELSTLQLPPFRLRGSPTSSSVPSRDHSNSLSYGSGGDCDLHFDEEEQQRQFSASPVGDRRASRSMTSGSAKRHRSHGPLQTTPIRHTTRRRTCSTKTDAMNAEIQQRSRRRGRPTLQESVDALVLGQLRADGIALPPHMVAELSWCEEDSTDAVPHRGEAATGVAAAAGAAVPVKDEAKRLSADPTCSGNACFASDAEADFSTVLQEVRALVRHGPYSGACRGTSTTTTPVAGTLQGLPVDVDKSSFQLPQICAQLSSRLPMTSTWFAQIEDFCSLLDDMAVAVADDAHCAVSAEEDRQKDAKKSVRPKSPTPNTLLTQEYASARGRGSSSSTASSLHRPYSYTSTAVNTGNCFNYAEQLLLPEGEEGGSDHLQRHGDGLVRVRSTNTSAADQVQTSPISPMLSPHQSVAHTGPSSHSSASSSVTFSPFREVSPSARPCLEEEQCNASTPGQESGGLRAATLLANVWLGGFDVSGGSSGSHFASAATAPSIVVNAVPPRVSASLEAPPTTKSSQNTEVYNFLRHGRILPTAAEPSAEQHGCTQATQRQRQQTLLQRQEALLRRRCVRVRVDPPPSLMRGYLPSTLAAGALAPDDAATPGRWLPNIRRGKVTPVVDYKAVAEHLRALCALLQSDLIIVRTLQELSKLVHNTSAPLTSSTSGSFAAAARLLVSLQQHRRIKTRYAQEASMLCDDGIPSAFSASRAHSLSSISDPLPPPGCGNGSTSSDHGTALAPLMLSVLHPMSALGYTPMLGSATSTTASGAVDANHKSADETLDNEERLARYIVSVAPYLLAWQRGAACELGIGNGSLQQEVPPSDGRVADAGMVGALPLAHTLYPATLSTLPLPVWVYLESLTTMLLEEARKLNAMYELYALVVAEAALQSRCSCLSSASGDADIGAIGNTTFPLAPVWHGGTDETLISYVRRRGRAASVAQGMGVLGMAVPLDNGLEKYVTPVSCHLLNSFDQLEGRHLLHGVFQEVQLSDVVARARARREDQVNSAPSGKDPSPHAPSVDDDEGFERFTLPPGALSTAVSRSAAGARRGLRDAEHRSSLRGGSRGASGGENEADQATEQRRRGDTDSGGSLQRPVRATARRIINLSGSGETRHAIIEGFVRYLTGGDRRRGSTTSEDVISPSRSADQRSTAESGGSPRHQRASSQAAANHHSGLTLDVPHTSSLLEEMDTRLERGASNVALIRSVEQLLHTDSLVEALNIGKFLSYSQSELSTRHYFNARAATFTTRHTLPSYNDACVSVVQCRWQPVFQSTMCFCPVTRRRCLDPLVCGALLTCVTLPPQEIVCSVPETSQSSSPTQGVSRVSADATIVSAVTATSPTGMNRQVPNTIRVQRSRFERRSDSTGMTQQRPTQAPSTRSEMLPQSGSLLSFSTPGMRTDLPSSPRQRHQLPHDYGHQQHPRPPVLPFPHAAPADPLRIISASSLFPSFFLREPSTVPDAARVARIMTRAVAALYEEPVVFARHGDEESERNDTGSRVTNATAAAPPPLTNDASQALRAVTLSLEAPPVTKNLLASPDRAQASLLNPPTLLECGHVVSHKTYLDLRTTARRANRNTTTAAAGTTVVVCCPYCSKVTAVRDAVTLSYLY